MRQSGGYARITGPNGIIEYDTFTCGHCGCIRFVKPKQDHVSFCRLCMKPICADCDKEGRCDPLEKKLDRVERTQDFRRWFLECS